jgi:Tol biopolymer transport system component
VLILATRKQEVLTQGADDYDPAYSPDGRRIVFGRSADRTG